MIAGEFPIELDAGANYSQSMELTDPTSGLPIDLTGYTGVAQIRSSYSAPKPLVTFTVVSGGTNGVITMSCLPAATESLPFVNPDSLCDLPIKGVWDLFVTDPGGIVTRLVRGIAKIYPRVTQ